MSRVRIGIFARLAGASPEHLAAVPALRGFYSRLGAALLLPFANGALGVTALLHATTHTETFDNRLLAVGILAGILLVVVDRILISVRARSRPSRFTLNVVRVGVSLALAVVISEPAISLLFRDEAVEAAKVQFRNEKVLRLEDVEERFDDRIAERERRIEPRTEALELLVADLRADIDEVEEDADATRRACAAEINTGRGGAAGFGPEAAYLCPVAEQAAREAAIVRTQNRARIELVRARQDRLASKIDDLVRVKERSLRAIERDAFTDKLGAWERIEFARSAVGWWFWGGLMLLLCGLDMLPVLVKIFAGKTAYDEIVERAAADAAAVSGDVAERARLARLHRHRIENEQREAEIATTRQSAQAGVRIHGSERERDVAEAEIEARLQAEIKRIESENRLAEAKARGAEWDLRAGRSESPPPSPPNSPGSSRPPHPGLPDETVEYTFKATEEARPSTIPASRDEFVEMVRQQPLLVHKAPVGMGAYSSVHAARWRISLLNGLFDDQWMAAKLPFPEGLGLRFDALSKEDQDRALKARRSLRGEIDFYERWGGALKHAPRFLGSEKDRDKPILLLEYFPRGNLHQWIFGDEGRASITVPAWLALAWIENSYEVGADLWERDHVLVDGKLPNFLVRGGLDDQEIAIRERCGLGLPGSLVGCDFGSVVKRGQAPREYTRYHLPPEYLRPSPQAHPAGDAFSIGSGYYRLVTLEHPVALEALVSPDVPDPRKFNERIPDELAYLLVDLCALAPERRIAPAPMSAGGPEIAASISQRIEGVRARLRENGTLYDVVIRKGDRLVSDPMSVDVNR